MTDVELLEYLASLQLLELVVLAVIAGATLYWGGRRD